MPGRATFAYLCLIVSLCVPEVLLAEWLLLDLASLPAAGHQLALPHNKQDPKIIALVFEYPVRFSPREQMEEWSEPLAIGCEAKSRIAIGR